MAYQKEATSRLPTSVAISDVIKIVSDLGNKIPDKSWMLYLLELFNRQNIPVELNLICSFNDDGKFHAIFGGVNRYEFKIKPTVGHSYLRQIIMEPSKRQIEYGLMDENSGQTDSFFFDVGENSFDFSISKHFTGLEWHNRTGNSPYQIRYEVEVSNLAYGINDDPYDPQSVAYYPYNQLMPDGGGGLVKDYPVSFPDFKT
ncbi:MAG: hypothetical protein ACREBB_07925 [Nitrosotalea sp.]